MSCIDCNCCRSLDPYHGGPRIGDFPIMVDADGNMQFPQCVCSNVANTLGNRIDDGKIWPHQNAPLNFDD